MQALDRLISILECVAGEGRPVGAADVARAMDLPLSTVVRLMRQLAEAGLLYRAPGDARYSLGSRIFTLASTGISRVDLVETATPVMRQLRDRVGETVSLHVRRGDQRVCLAEVQSEHQVRRVVPPGMVQELCRTATGEVLLLDASPAEIDAAAARAKLNKSERKQLAARLADIAAKGYAISDNYVEGLTGISAPLREGGRVVAALTISGPTARLHRAVAEKQAPALLDAARALSSAP